MGLQKWGMGKAPFPSQDVDVKYCLKSWAFQSWQLFKYGKYVGRGILRVEAHTC